MSQIPGITSSFNSPTQTYRAPEAAHPYSSFNSPTQAYRAPDAAHSSSDSVTLSPQAQALMHIDVPRTDPNDVKGTGDTTAHKNADGSWTTNYNGQTYTSNGKDGKIYDKDGKEVAHADGNGNIYDSNGKLVAKYTLNDNGDKAVIDVTGDPKNNINMSKDGTYSAKGDATAHKNADGTWTANYKGQTYTSNGKDGKIYDKDGKEVAHADGKGNIYDNDGNLVGTYAVAGDNGDNAIIDVKGDNSDNTTMYW